MLFRFGRRLVVEHIAGIDRRRVGAPGGVDHLLYRRAIAAHRNRSARYPGTAIRRDAGKAGKIVSHPKIGASAKVTDIGH